MKPAYWVIGLLVFGGCATKRATPEKAKVDLTKIKKIAVSPFSGPSGKAMADEMVRQLIAQSITVVDPTKNPDAILIGTVGDFRPANKQLVYLGSVAVPVAEGKTVTVTNPVLSQTSAPLAPETLPRSPNAPMVSVHASLSAVAKLAHASSGEILWAYGTSYEALDTSTAMQAVSATLVQSLQTVLHPSAVK